MKNLFKTFIRFSFLVMSGLMSLPALSGFASGESFTPDGIVHSEGVTVFMAVDGAYSPGLKPFSTGGHGKFFLTDWRHAEDSVSWTFEVPTDARSDENQAEKRSDVRSDVRSDEFQVRILLEKKSQQPARVTLTTDAQTLSLPLDERTIQWDRLVFPETATLKPGKHQMTLTIHSDSNAADDAPNLDFRVLSVELVKPEAAIQQEIESKNLRADTQWIQQAGFGLMVHWTSQSAPLSGKRKSYSEAVRDFDVTRFAEQAEQMGAHFVVFTTSHAQMFLPAPIQSLDEILPGRTTSRDLIQDLAVELQKRGIRLMLYFHLGASSDPEWQTASGFWETDTTHFFENWKKIVSEIGLRYGDLLAGWWFDDGTVNYYYRSPDWKSLLLAARAGNPHRLVGFNPWELPSPTPFQDLYLGEGTDCPSGTQGLLENVEDGRYPTGSHRGLQSCATLMGSPRWVHDQENQKIPPIRWTTNELTEKIAQFRRFKNVLIINVEISQEGTILP